ncbi:hypothetical protein ERO13_A09G023300v2 [Gossypium hirsutum]|uniref:Uncharacterized protein n=1 Tax=Gossypium hirsutum TaxID=3635 RepID=A0ABM2YSC8_GOSHI|nr:uncharacterized protein LOC121206513 [Gossypium hirsutum]KAG4182092.1 hypothetical protein ERO13_A09G023300v2 [Gossypium hirsutum]
MEEKKENVNTALFTAGIAVLLVCFKRALLLSLVQQWRAWVFLVLNLVLLAIFFTSMTPNSSQISQQEMNKNEEEMKKKRGNFSEAEACTEDHQVSNSKQISKSKEVEDLVEKEVVVEEEEEEEEEENIETLKLSKEELNERVEAFIAMFRQQLALDARKGRKQADFSKKKHTNLSSDRVNRFVLKVEG